MHTNQIVHFLLAAVLFTVVNSGPIKHDQRQEGELNVRADLENFVILIVPTSKNTATGLLDLLRNAIPSLKSTKQKHHHELKNSAGTKHFIESKSAAPYHVDISRTKNNLAKLHPEQITGSNGEILIAHSPTVALKHLERRERSVDGNAKNKVGPHTRKTRTVDVFADDSIENMLFSVENQYEITPIPISIELDEEDENDQSFGDESDVDTKKNDIDDTDTKEELLLLGAIEQCGPDMKRDSEGVCQFIGDK